jgi:DNA polymerase III subunit gamma/tau
MSLYRQYRPQTFADVVGQEHIVTTLKQAADAGKLAHAYLFAGTRGTGKTSTARILAKTLLTNGMTDEALKKQVEQAVEEGTIVDLIEIDAASNTGVDNIRDLIEKIQFTPVIAAAKVYIIDEVHMLSKGAFNALLKTLEEPPPYAYFILATTELHKIPATIQSRCQRFLFRRIDEKDIAGRLRFVADAENITADDDALLAIAHHAQGGMRDALSLLDQLRSLPAITINDVRERIGETGFQHVERVMNAIETGDRSAILAVIRELEDTGVALETFVRLMLDAVRISLHQAITVKKSTAHLEPLLSTLLQTARDLRASALPALTLESALLSLLKNNHVPEQMPAVQSAKPVISSPLPVTDHGQRTTDSDTPAASNPSPAASTPTSDLSSIRQNWNAILEKVDPPSARMSLKNGRLHDEQDGILMLAFSSDFHRNKASSPEGLHNLETSIEAVTGQKLRVKCLLESELSGPGPLAQQDAVDLASAVGDVF